MTALAGRIATLLVLFVTACGSPERGTPESERWAALKVEIRERYPDVETITTAELRRTLADPDAPAPLLLDNRAPAEFAVSHLAGAVSTPNVDAALERLASEPRGRPVVVYCSVGYRSAGLTRELSAAGFTNVRNLEGSIFEWANQGGALVRGGRAVEAVHPYDEDWGALLARELWDFGDGGEPR